jgi:hypothetical protein
VEVRRPFLRPAHLAGLLALAILAALLVRASASEGEGRVPTGATAGASTGAQAARLPARRLFAARSPFNRRISRRPHIDRDSGPMVAGLERSVSEEGATITSRMFTVPLYSAGPGTPRRRVRLTAPWRPRNAMLRVPLPANASPDPSSDGHLAVIDRQTGCEYDFWQFRRTRRGYAATWGNAINVDGSGVYPRGYSARGSGFALTAGVVLPRELVRGRIDHALLLSYPGTRSGGPVHPATESDGRTRGRGALPEGARLQLDPSLDLDTLGLQGYERTIARALQVYGAIVGDTGGRGVSFYAVHPMSVSADPYAAILPDEEYPQLQGIPFGRMRVLNLGPQDRHARPRLVSTGCGRFSRR